VKTLEFVLAALGTMLIAAIFGYSVYILLVARGTI
jgi:hypothetical protein